MDERIYNVALLQELVETLPPALKMKWGSLAAGFQRVARRNGGGVKPGSPASGLD